EKDGALWLKTKEMGDEKDKVLVKKDGTYAYITPDIAYHQDKCNREFDLIFTFLGADHQGQIPKLIAAMKALGNDTDKFHFIVAQWMRLVRGGKLVKLSKRKGVVWGPQDLLNEIGYDATRFFMVQHALTSHMDLDLDLAKERSERNPVYYVQYAYVRLQSILRKAKEGGIIEDIGVTVALTSHPSLTHTTEVDLMKMMYRLPDVLYGISQTYAVHQLPYYAYDLAKAVHVFYKYVPVLAGENKEVVESRLQLVLAAKHVLGTTLDILGISKPDVM
ncbi:MAG: arginine--tRNA ligase, partial [Acidobacteriota bacterium]